MTTPAIEQALENIYTSLHNDNEDIDLHIRALKEAMNATGEKAVVVNPARLAQSNREGRKTMQAYFRKRGVTISFAA